MSKLKDPDPFNLNSLIEDEDYTINLDNTYDVASTVWVDDNISDINISDININSGTYTIDTDSIDTNVYTGSTDINIDWIYNNITIDPTTVEQMCKEYPALEKVWRNFKSVYDMCKQDYEGKKKAGEIDDDIPF